MNKRIVVFLLVIALGVFAGCAAEQDSASVPSDGASSVSPSSSVSSSSEVKYGTDSPIYINLNGKVYVCSRQSEVIPDQDQITGTIRSAGAEPIGDAGEPLPTEHEQVVRSCDFIVGQPYAVIGDEVLLLVEDNWCCCTLYFETE